MNIKINKLDSKGVVHHFLIALLAITLVASFGAYKVFFSSASTTTAFSYAEVDSNALFDVTTEGGCWLAGREWKPAHTAKVKDKKDKKAKTKQVPAGCAKTCRYGDGKDIASTAKGVKYCKKAIDLIDPAKCVNEYHRRFVHEVGCAKRVADVSLNNSPHCSASPYNNYVREEGVSSNCVEETVEVPAGKPKTQAASEATQQTTPAGEPIKSKAPKNFKPVKKKKKTPLKQKAKTPNNQGESSSQISKSPVSDEMIKKCHDKGYLALPNGCSSSCYTGGGYTKTKSGKCEKKTKQSIACKYTMWCTFGKSGGGAITKKEKEAAKKSADAENTKKREQEKVKKNMGMSW